MFGCLLDAPGVVSGGSRGGAWGPCPPLILGEKKEMTEEEPAGQVNQNRAPTLAQSLDPPLETFHWMKKRCNVLCAPYIVATVDFCHSFYLISKLWTQVRNLE